MSSESLRQRKFRNGTLSTWKCSKFIIMSYELIFIYYLLLVRLLKKTHLISWAKRLFYSTLVHISSLPYFNINLSIKPITRKNNLLKNNLFKFNKINLATYVNLAAIFRPLSSVITTYIAYQRIDRFYY